MQVAIRPLLLSRAERAAPCHAPVIPVLGTSALPLLSPTTDSADWRTAYDRHRSVAGGVFGAGPPPNVAETLARSMLRTELLIGLMYVVMGRLLVPRELIGLALVAVLLILALPAALSCSAAENRDLCTVWRRISAITWSSLLRSAERQLSSRGHTTGRRGRPVCQTERGDAGARDVSHPWKARHPGMAPEPVEYLTPVYLDRACFLAGATSIRTLPG